MTAHMAVFDKSNNSAHYTGEQFHLSENMATEQHTLTTDHMISPASKQDVSSASEHDVSPSSKERLTTLVLSASVLYLGPISSGCCIAYSSPAIIDMEKPGNKIKLNLQEQSLFCGLLTIGAIFGSVTSGPVADYLGRKLTIMITCLIFTFGWGLMILAGYVSNEYLLLLYAARLVTGLAIGAICMCLPVYITELSTPKVRGALGTGITVSLNVGIFIGYTIGIYTSWLYLAVICDIFPVLLLLCIIPIPESPVWLVRNKRKREAKETLIWLRGEYVDVDIELETIDTNIKSETKMTLSDLCRPDVYKPFLLVFTEFFFQQASGISPVLFNAASIFKSATDSIDPNVAAAIVAIVMILGAAVAALVMDRAGRRPPFLISVFFVGLCCFILGGYYYVKHTDPTQAHRLGWLPLPCLVVFVFTYALGYGCVPWVMVGEVFSAQTRGTATSMIMALAWLMAFVFTKIFVDLQQAVYDHGVFWIFGGSCVISFLFILKFVPETKGKSLDEIQRMFKN